MNTALEEDILQEEYTYADNSEVMKISERLLEEHKEAFIALANA